MWAASNVPAPAQRMVRVGAVHYNTLAEVRRLEEALHRIAG